MTKSKVVSHFMCQCIIRSLVICILTPRFPLKCRKQTMVCNLFRLLGSSTVLTEIAESVIFWKVALHWWHERVWKDQNSISWSSFLNYKIYLVQIENHILAGFYNSMESSFEKAENTLFKTKYFTLLQPIIFHEKRSKHLYLIKLCNHFDWKSNFCKEMFGLRKKVKESFFLDV